MDFINVDRETPMLLPVDLRDWVPEDDPVHFILEAAERVDMSTFKVKRRSAGKSQYPPRMMLALLIYCYSHGLFGSRRIERATYRDVCVRFLTGDTHPDHDTICAFRRENKVAFSKCFLEVLLLARELKLFQLGTVSIDGTHLRANASKDRNLTYERAQQLDAKLSADIAELLHKADTADKSEADQRLPREIARRQALREQMDAAQRALEARAKKRASAERPAYEAKREAHQKRNGQGRPPEPPDDQPGPGEQTNLSDPDSRLMRKGQSCSVTQSYNAQATVDADGSQLIVSAHISQCSADTGQLEAGIDNIPAELGRPEKTLADSGYVDSEAIERIQQSGIDLYVSVQNEAAQNQRPYDFRPEPASAKEPKTLVNPVLIDMRDKIRTEAGREIYSKRQQSVEPAFGIIKHAMGFRQFLLRSLEKVSTEWTLVCLAYNCKRLFNLKMAQIPA